MSMSISQDRTRHKKVTLIGMPCAGKTTIGRAFAREIQWSFIDLDEEVERVEQDTLIQVMNQKGPRYFRDMEYGFLQELPVEERLVISPAGSIIYHTDAMRWISRNSLVVFLDAPFSIIEERLRVTPKAVANLAERGLLSIWDERMPMYKQYSDFTIQTQGASVQEVVRQLTAVLHEYIER